MIVDGMIIVVFFFKQKTAYEMRISDWSSDVCSSDLGAEDRTRDAHHADRHHGEQLRRGQPGEIGPDDQRRFGLADKDVRGGAEAFDLGDARSEEHTSELQSLMRISYAVFCLKKKIKETKKKQKRRGKEEKKTKTT